MRRRLIIVVPTAVTAMLAALAPIASAAQTPVSSCETHSVPGDYALSADLAAVDTTCRSPPARTS
jgi:hypothetical protein